MDAAKIFKLKQDLNNFLNEHPELKKLQTEIEQKLKNAGSQHNRMVISQQLMLKSVDKLNKAIIDLLNTEFKHE